VYTFLVILVYICKNLQVEMISDRMHIVII